MATAIITLKDSGDGQVDVSVSFGEAGGENESPAHALALDLLRAQFGSLDPDEEGAGHG